MQSTCTEGKLRASSKSHKRAKKKNEHDSNQAAAGGKGSGRVCSLVSIFQIQIERCSITTDALALGAKEQDRVEGIASGVGLQLEVLPPTKIVHDRYHPCVLLHPV